MTLETPDVVDILAWHVVTDLPGADRLGELPPTLSSAQAAPGHQIALPSVTTSITTQHRRPSSSERDLAWVDLLHELQLSAQKLLNGYEQTQESIAYYVKSFPFMQGLLDDVEKLGGMVLELSATLQNHQARDYMGTHQFASFPLRELLEQAARHHRDGAERRGISIDVADVSDLTVWISEAHMRIVFDNLFNNAVKYSFKGRDSRKRSVKVHAWNERDRALVRISNYGVDILEAELKQVFDLGFRGRFAQAEHRTGSGTGLFTAQRMILAMDGKLTITSEKAGDGRIPPYHTTVTIDLPSKEALKWR